MGASSEGKERRHQRTVYISAFAYLFPSRSSDIHFGVTSNMSDSGICVYSDARPEEGESIEFKSSLPVPSSRATVRWVRKDVGELYKMGLMFVE